MTRELGIHGEAYGGSYTAEQNEQFAAEFGAIMLELREAFLAGEAINSDAAQQAIAKHYAFCLKFWKPTREAYKSLAMSYLLPSPYRESIEAVEPGLAKYNYDAIVIWADANLD
jgi:hypothetical protein